MAEPAQPAAFLDGKDTAGTVNGSTDGTAGNDIINGITLKSGDASVNNNFGELTPASISGFVYVDANNNGVKESGESGIGSATAGAGVLVTLTGTNDLGIAITQTTTTAADGSYSFTGLRPSNSAGYTVTETQPSGYLDGKETAGAVNSITDGSANPGGLNDVIGGIKLNSGDASVNNNFGELLPTKGCIDVLAFNDTNGNGTYQSGETGYAKGLSVSLISLGADGKFGTADDKVLQTVTTAADGTYDFNNLTPGQYAVEVCTPTTGGVSFTTPSGVCGTSDYWNQHKNLWNGSTSDDGPSSTDICYKATNPCTGSSSGTGFLIGDWNHTGTSSFGEHTIYCSLSQAQAILASSDNQDARYVVAKEAITGWMNYLQTGVCDANTKADINSAVQWLVQHSSDQSTDFNGNGNLALTTGNCQVTYSSSAWQSTGTTYTGGYFSGGGCGGTSGSSDSGQTIADNLHNDNTENCNVQLVTVIASTNCATVNVGIQPVANSSACIDGNVFLDGNGNGIFDSGEKGKAGIVVTLKAMSGSGSCDATVATTTTDANGAYSFENLGAGQYQVTYSNLPTGYGFTSQNSGNGTGDYWGQHGSLWDGKTGGQVCYSVADPISHTTTAGGILIGDFNHNGTGFGENTIYYTQAEAMSILNASAATENSDARYVVAKDLISEWLNTLETGTCSTKQQTDITNAVNWLQQHTPDENFNGHGDGNLITSASYYKCSTSSTTWNDGLNDGKDGQGINQLLSDDITKSSTTQIVTVDPGQCTTNNVGLVQVTGSGCQSSDFWKAHTEIWDCNKTNDGSKPVISGGDICYSVSDASAGGKPSLLIGDWNHDGKTGSGENTICISDTTAQQILNSTSTDARYTVEKSLITSWLNTLCGNSSDQVKTDINNAVVWLENNTANGSGICTTDTSKAVSTTNIDWHTVVGTTPDAAHSGYYYGESICNALNYYNASGAGIAPDAAGAITGDLVTLVGTQQYQANFLCH